MKAPFPWFGGKRRVAAEVWRRFGDVPVYAEPFAGSLAVMLGRPSAPGVETVNDLDGFVANAWRAILHDPEATAHAADWPVNENDLTARHLWLVERREKLQARLEGDPDYFDAKIAGWWMWGVCSWIGSGWCSGNGPWGVTDTDDRQLVHLGNKGRGVSRQLVHLGNKGRGDPGNGECGLREWMRALSDRLRCVRVCSGDWSRILTHSALGASLGGVRGVFLDPPYSAEADRDMGCYSIDSGTVAHDVRAWCLSAPREYRIALCGYEGEGHDPLVDAGWSVFAWKARGGMGNQGKVQNENRHRERIWFSPACIQPEESPQQDLL